MPVLEKYRRTVIQVMDDLLDISKSKKNFSLQNFNLIALDLRNLLQATIDHVRSHKEAIMQREQVKAVIGDWRDWKLNWQDWKLNGGTKGLTKWRRLIALEEFAPESVDGNEYTAMLQAAFMEALGDGTKYSLELEKLCQYYIPLCEYACIELDGRIDLLSSELPDSSNQNKEEHQPLFEQIQKIGGMSQCFLILQEVLQDAFCKTFNKPFAEYQEELDQLKKSRILNGLEEVFSKMWSSLFGQKKDKKSVLQSGARVVEISPAFNVSVIPKTSPSRNRERYSSFSFVSTSLGKSQSLLLPRTELTTENLAFQFGGISFSATGKKEKEQETSNLILITEKLTQFLPLIGLVGYIGLLSVLGLLNFVGSSLSAGLILLGIAHAFFIVWTVLCLCCAWADRPHLSRRSSYRPATLETSELTTPIYATMKYNKSPLMAATCNSPATPQRTARSAAANSARRASDSLVQPPTSEEQKRRYERAFTSLMGPGSPSSPLRGGYGVSPASPSSIFSLSPASCASATHKHKDFQLPLGAGLGSANLPPRRKSSRKSSIPSCAG